VWFGVCGLGFVGWKGGRWVWVVPWKRPPKEKKRVAIFVVVFGCWFCGGGDRSVLE
jgi:hypothetical protein